MYNKHLSIRNIPSFMSKVKLFLFEKIESIKVTAGLGF